MTIPHRTTRDRLETALGLVVGYLMLALAVAAAVMALVLVGRLAWWALSAPDPYLSTTTTTTAAGENYR